MCLEILLKQAGHFWSNDINSVNFHIIKMIVYNLNKS